jgi:hypothetical protein
MKQDEIIANEQGVTLFGFPLGFTPTIRDLDLAVEGELTRGLLPLNGRQLHICDSQGISWLVDLNLGLVLWFDVVLARLSHRKQDDHDPRNVFKGKIIIRRWTVEGPFSLPTAELIRKVKIHGLDLHMVPDRKQICAISLAFLENAQRSDSVIQGDGF